MVGHKGALLTNRDRSAVNINCPFWRKAICTNLTGNVHQHPVLVENIFNNHLFVERFDHENRSHRISDLQKAAEEDFSNLVLKASRRAPPGARWCSASLPIEAELGLL